MCIARSVGAPSFADGLVLARGQLEGRKECCAMLSDTWHGAKMQFDNWEVFEQISLVLWSELAEPGARQEDDSEA